MAPKRRSGVTAVFSRAANAVARASGSVWSFTGAVAIILVWIVSGPFFHFSDTWQLVINTGTTIITFLMVFLLQHSQNRDTKALQLKLDELVAATQGASNHLIDVEDLSEEELDDLHRRYKALAKIVGEREAADETLSVERISSEDAARG